MADQGKQVWIGTVEVRPEREGNDVLGAAKGAFDGQVAGEIADLIAKARANPHAILWGTLHTYQKDRG